jgi:hypothetical protein
MAFDPSSAKPVDSAPSGKFDPSSAKLFDPSSAQEVKQSLVDRVLTAAQDVNASLVSGAGSLVQMPGQLYGLTTGDFSDTGMLKAGRQMKQHAETMKSEELKDKEKTRSAKIREAEKEGVTAAAKTAFLETVRDPSLLLNFVAEQLPNLLPGMAIGRGLGALGMTTGAVRGAVATGATQQGTDIGAGSYVELQKELVKRGVPEDEASAQALGLARKVGLSAAAISLIAQKLPGFVGLEGEALEKLMAGAVSNSAKKGIVATTGRAAKAGLGETASEMLEEGGGKVVQNYYAQKVDPNRKLTDGLGEAMGMAAVGGATLGTAAGAMQKAAPEEAGAPPERIEPTLNAPAPAAAQPQPAAPQAQPPQPQAAQPQPPADPRKDALVQAYVKQGMAPDDATMLADQDLAALTASPQAVVDQAAQAQQAAVQQVTQLEAQNVPSAQPALDVAQPATGQPSVEMLGGRPAEGPAGGINGAIQRGLDAAERIVGSVDGGEGLPRAPVDALTAEIPTYEGAQKVLNQFAQPEKYMIMEVEGGFVIVPRPAQAAAPVVAEAAAPEVVTPEATTQTITPEAVVTETESEFNPATAEPVSTEVIKEEETPSGTETIEAEQTEAQGQEEPAADESASAVATSEEADAILADTEQTETDTKASIDEGKTAQEDKTAKYEKSNAAKKLNTITKQQIALADKLILMISDLKRVSNFAEKHTEYKNFAAIDVRYKAARDELNNLLDYFEDLSTKGTAEPHRAAKAYLKTLDTNIDEHIKGIKQRAEEGRKAQAEQDAVKAREKVEPVSAEKTVEETKEDREAKKAERAAEAKQAAGFKSRLDAYIDEDDKTALAKHYGEKTYNQIAENKFIEDINTVTDEGLGSVSPVVQDIIKSISPDVSKQIVDKSKTDLGSRADKLLAALAEGLIPQRLRRNFPNPEFNKAKSLIRALEMITKDAANNTEYDILVADYLLSPQNIKSINDITLSVIEDNDKKGLKEAGKAFKDARGMYVLSPDGEPHIYLRGESFGFEDQGINTLTVLHEGLHGAGNQKINLVQLARKYKFADKVPSDLIEAVEGLERLMERAKGTYEAGSRDKEIQTRLDSLARGGAFEDVKEFFTYAMTTPSMQEFLQNEVKGEVTKTSGFSRFVELALKLLGINPKLNTGLKDLFVYSDVVIKEKVAKPNVQEIAKLLSAEKAKLYSQAKKQKSASQDAERKLEAARRDTQLIEDMGSLMNVAKNPALWSDYIKLNFRNISTPAYKGLLATMPTNVVIDTGTALGIGSLADVNANVQKMHTYRTQELQKAQDTAVPWIKLNATEQKKLAEVMHYATDVQVDPDTTSGKDAGLDARWNALDNDTKEVYRKVRDFYKNKYKLYRALLEQRVNDASLDPEERKQLMAAIRATYETGAKMEPYFPFMRYGEYWASVGKGDTKEFHMFESAGLRDLFLERRVKELNLSGDNRTLSKMLEDEDIRAGNDVASLRKDTANESANLKQMFATIDGMKSANDTEKSRLKDEIFQMHLLTLPEASFRKQFIHRKGTAGFSGDALRNFVEASARITNQISRVKYGPKINVAMSAANDSLAGNPDQAKLGMITRELELRLEDELAPEFKDDALDKAARTANKAAFIWLLTSVKSAANQMFSVVSFTMPTLAKYHGWGATLKEMGKMSAVWNEVGATRTDKNGNVTFIPSVSIAHSKALKLNPVEQRAFQIMVDRGVADATRTYDLFMRKGAPSADYNNKTANVVKAMGTLFHATERLSREVSYMAAFRLEMKKHGDFDRATENAMHVVNEALFDYSAWNTPRAVRSAPARVVTQFMKFPLFTTIYLARNFRIMMKPMDGETRAGAFKAFSGTLGMTTLLAGTAGLPMYSAIFGVLQSLRNAMRDDDEPVPMEEENLERWFRKVWLPETFGEVKIMGSGLDDIIDTGVLNAATGVDFASGLSLNNMWLRDAPEASSWKDAYGQTVTGFLGPAVGLGQSWASGIDDINKGDTLKGMEKLTPALFRGGITAYRYSTEGAVTSIGSPIKGMDEFTYWQLAAQVAGYKTTGLARLTEDNFAISQQMKRINGERSKLLGDLNRAAIMDRESDFEKAVEGVVKFNVKYPTREIEMDDIDKAIDRRIEMLSNSNRGVYTPDDFLQLEVLRERSLERIEEEAATK